MKKQQATAYFRDGEVQIALFVYIEEQVQVCYAPELDLYGYGTGEAEALASFAVVLDNYLDYVTTHQTLDRDLKRLGWAVNAETRLYTAPPLHELLRRNTDFAAILQQRPFRKLDRLVPLAA